jgi:hypothetical protein
MNDPERIMDGHSDELATTLMRSVRRDAPSPRARAATLAAVGIGAAALPATTGVAAAAGKVVGITAFGFAKSIAIGAGTAVVLLAVVHQTSKPSASVVMAPVESTAPAPVAPPVQQASPPPSVAATAAPELAPLAAEKPAPARLRAQPTAEPARAESTLAAEVAALDGARSAARNRDAAGALALLDAYERDFPGGVLAVEATVLRIEALANSGQSERALAVGRALLSRSPSGPHAERIRSIVARIEAARGEGTNE